MDQIKIGRFISEKRKAQGMTQAQLAEKLGITDRAVSKWETGRSMPDVSLMMELCSQLGITVKLPETLFGRVQEICRSDLGICSRLFQEILECDGFKRIQDQ